MMCIHRYELVLMWMRWFSIQSVSTLNGRCGGELACYYTNCQQTHKRHSEVVEVEISCAESIQTTSQFLALGGSPDTFVIWRPPHRGRLGHCCTCLLLRFIVQCCFFGLHVGPGHQLVWVWSECHAFVLWIWKPQKFLLKSLEAFMHQQKFPAIW